jgi:hypothetical protein
MNKYNSYYLMEDLDVTNDKIPDGVLVREFKIDKKTGRYVYVKNCYITEGSLKKIIDDVVIKEDVNKNINTIMVSNVTINKIRNNHLPVDEIPKIVISKNSHFSHLIKGKHININKLYIDIRKLVDLHEKLLIKK